MAQTTLRDYLQTTEDAISSGRITDALANCQQILRQYPNSLEVQRLLGEVYLAQGDLAKAQQAFDWVLINDPENVIVYCSRALISERMNDYDTALDCYQQAYELSRGNSQIRQEFNLLSSKVGQQQFIFSRAGLARLFMRGDLLPQAAQEWEIVLNASPERLDARTGLLETYWRQGLYDKVEQLAQQILNDVPGCLKALLLLAHVIYAQNMQMAQHLLEQASMLDPDMVMAQELFSDLMASQARDPFLSLLKKASTQSTQPEPVAHFAASSPSSASYANRAYDNVSQAPPQFSDSLLAWENLDDIIGQHQQQATQEPSWNNNHTPSELKSWQPPQDEQRPENRAAGVPSERLTPAPTHPESPEGYDKLISPDEMQPDDLARQEASNGKADDALNEFQENQQSWSDLDRFDMSEQPAWDSQSAESSAFDSAASWDSASIEQDVPVPPAWLEMLTGSGWKPQAGQTPAAQADEHISPAIPSQTQSIPQQDEAADLVQPIEQELAAQSEQYHYAATSWEEQFMSLDASPLSQLDASPFAQEEDDDHSFGPAWLRSLGATSMDDVPPLEEGIQHQSLAEEFSQESFDALTEPAAPSRPLSSHDSESPREPLEAAASNSGTAQGPTPQDAFQEKPKTPAEIWLSQAANMLSQPDQNVITTLEALEHDLRSQGFVQLEPGTLSTVAEEQATPSASGEGIPSNAAEEQQSSTEEEPLWPAAVHASPAPEVVAQPISVLTPEPQLVSMQQPEPVAAAHVYPAQYDSLLDSDLETTMKRPVVKLQAMQPRSSVPHAQPISKHRSNGQAAQNDAPDGNLNSKERLIKGYQHQRAGEYDDAMQEYRVIIRNAPELLGEVISNLRALLKLAPKYAPGYRVLGDAYMRQGEYLQAMESYNKALTMARKAKS
jgi:tetratricopeptide (TPR) repeat protein